MTELETEAAAPVTPKAPPPLMSRAARPAAVRLRGGVVKAIVIGGAVLLSGSLAWAFVVQPELRAGAREKVAEHRADDAGRGTVRPAETVTDQPASYDKLPPPRGMTEEAQPVGVGDDLPVAELQPAYRAPAPRT